MIDQALKEWIPRLLRRFDRSQTLSVDKQIELLNSLPEPKDDFERSFNQYICQRFYYGYFFNFAASVAAVLLLPYQIRKLRKTREPKKDIQSVELLLVADAMPKDIFPMVLKTEYSSWIRAESMNSYYFSEEDEEFYKVLKKKYGRHPYFLYKCLMKEAGYSYLIHNYRPLAICACGGEFTFTSSFLTAYCHSKNIAHYNTMHGEMFYYVLDAFTHFDRFYVWDEHYVGLLNSLRCTSDFIIELPTSVKIDFDKVETHGLATYDIKYYLSLERGKQLQSIANTLNKLIRNGYSVCARMHPRTTNQREIQRLMPEVAIENPYEISIEQSIKCADNVMAKDSTVLFQAYISGKSAVIDDISDAKYFRHLADRKYIMLGKCQVLSDFLQNNANAGNNL